MNQSHPLSNTPQNNQSSSSNNQLNNFTDLKNLDLTISKKINKLDDLVNEIKNEKVKKKK